MPSSLCVFTDHDAGSSSEEENSCDGDDHAAQPSASARENAEHSQHDGISPEHPEAEALRRNKRKLSRSLGLSSASITSCRRERLRVDTTNSGAHPFKDLLTGVATSKLQEKSVDARYSSEVLAFLGMLRFKWLVFRCPEWAYV